MEPGARSRGLRASAFRPRGVATVRVAQSLRQSLPLVPLDQVDIRRVDAPKRDLDHGPEVTIARS